LSKKISKSHAGSDEEDLTWLRYVGKARSDPVKQDITWSKHATMPRGGPQLWDYCFLLEHIILIDGRRTYVIPETRIPAQIRAKGHARLTEYLGALVAARRAYDAGLRGIRLANALDIDGKNEKTRMTIAHRCVRQAARLGFGFAPQDARENAGMMTRAEAQRLARVLDGWCRVNRITITLGEQRKAPSIARHKEGVDS
jgi:hypothetical protein